VIEVGGSSPDFSVPVDKGNTFKAPIDAGSWVLLKVFFGYW
jgi:hypothetical protein|tara:strand:+ start:776 stop:898 length:123 start_codon:yes stop_codon:yes gene_type:complete